MKYAEHFTTRSRCTHQQRRIGTGYRGLAGADGTELHRPINWRGRHPRPPPVHIEAGAGQAAQIAEFAYRNRLSVIVQMLYMSPDERLAFAHAYCLRLWQLNLTPNEPLVLLMEEAHNFIPQKMGDSPMMKDFARISSEGRKMGFTNIFVTQRTAKINKDILADCNFLFLHAVNIDNDFATYQGMLPYSKAEIKKMVMAMRPGEAITKTQNANGIHFNQVKFLLRETYHGGSTPTLDEEAPPPLRAIDADLLAQMRTLLATKTPARKEGVEQLHDTGMAHEAHVVSYIDDLRTKLGAANAAIVQLKEKAHDPDKDHVRDVMTMVANAAKSSSKIDIQPEKPNAIVDVHNEWDGRTELATTRAKNTQRRQFEAMIGTVKHMMPHHRRILVYLTQRENLVFEEPDLARYIGYSRKTIEKNRPAALIRMGLLRRGVSANKTQYIYQSTARKFIAEHYPDLDIDELVQAICKLEKV